MSAHDRSGQPSNQLAFAASQAAASSYPPKYNPVFLCGGVGLGKTHLLHSIGHQQLANRPSARIVYLSSERLYSLGSVEILFATTRKGLLLAAGPVGAVGNRDRFTWRLGARLSKG